MNKSILIMSILLSFFSCSKKMTPKTTEATTKAESSVPAQTTMPPEPVATPKSIETKLNIPDGIDPTLVASLKRTACFGKCPYYKVDIFENGRVIYEGMAHVAKIGKYEATISELLLEKIRQKATEISYLKLNDKYPLGNIEIADVPSTITYVRIGNEGKRINNNFDAPKALIEFEKWLDKEIDSLKFNKLSD